jgi:hypothetical protein
MTEPTRRIFLGNIPSADVIFTAGGDPIVAMVREGNARLDRERAEAEKARLAQVADGERARNTARAKAVRRFWRAARALKLLGGLR